MIPSQDVVGPLADRIERAYCRRHPQWLGLGLTPGVWVAAATRLLEAGEDDRNLPVDPELFVATQKVGRSRLDPWTELTQPRSLKNYLGAIRRIVAQLRGELRDEFRRGESRLLRGESLDQILASNDARISPLSGYILAHKAGRLDLALLARPAAENQDRACPLYRIACREMLPAHLYPTSVGSSAPEVETRRRIVFSLN